MALQFQLAKTPLPSDLPFFNYSGTDIPADVAVSIDTVNVLGNAGVSGIGIVPVAATGNVTIGVTQTVIKAGSSGPVRTCGIAVTTADGAITAGTVVDASAAASKVGFAKAHTAAKAQLGIALSTAADLDPVLVLVCPALNA